MSLASITLKSQSKNTIKPFIVVAGSVLVKRFTFQVFTQNLINQNIPCVQIYAGLYEIVHLEHVLKENQNQHKLAPRTSSVLITCKLQLHTPSLQAMACVERNRKFLPWPSMCLKKMGSLN